MKKNRIYAIIGGLILLLLKAFKMGRDKEKLKQNKQIVKNVKKVKKAVNSIDDNERKRLRKKYHRK